MFAAFYLIPARTKDKKISLKWIIYVALSFLTTGIFSSFLLVFSKSEFGAMQNEYVAITFSIATILSSLLTLFNVKVKKEPITIKLDYKLPLVALVIGGALGIYNLINVIAFKHFESYILSPIVSGSIMVLTMVVNAIINKEKPTTKMLIGVAFAVVAIVFLNL
jgi:drug/metabolite transporter (DMT)-like permease